MTEQGNKQYLGDGVYASFDGYQICLTTDYGVGAVDIIYLEPSVWSALQRYVANLNQGAARNEK